MPRFSRHRPSAPIVLLTDFGFRDSYVGVMKGVIRGLSRTVDIIDLSHNIVPQDVAEAAFVLASSYRYFPPGAIFVCVVDPGVGGKRAILYMGAGGQAFLAPDNGLLSVIAEEAGRTDLRKVTAEQYWLKDTSSTFHGRDIFAPVAARLAEGLDPSLLGPEVPHLARLELPSPIRAADGSLRGEIIYIDQFGNLITNIREGMVRRTFGAAPDHLEARVKRRSVPGLSTTYSDRQEGQLVALIGSSGYLEVAVNKGSAAVALGCEKGDSVALSVAQPGQPGEPDLNAPGPEPTRAPRPGARRR
jgi:S-adenosylmethionine hydrolase